MRKMIFDHLVSRYERERKREREKTRRRNPADALHVIKQDERAYKTRQDIIE